MGANLEKSLFAPHAYAVPLCPKGEIVFVCSLRPLWSCYAPRAFAVFICSATSKVSKHHAQPHRVSIWFAHPCSPYTIKSARVSAYLLPPLQSLITSRTYAVSFCSSTSKDPPCHTTLCSLYSSRNVLQSSYEQKQKSLRLLFCACSLHSYKIPLQSPYFAPTLKVLPHHARLSVSFCSVYLYGLGVTFAPLRLALTIGERAVSGSILYIFSTAGKCPNQWAVQCRHIRRSHRRYTQIYSRRV